MRVGAPVAFRGVAVGEVTEITALLDPAGSGIRVPVTVELRKGAVALVGGGELTAETMTTLVEKGLRARLELESLVTARLFVGLDFYPGTTATMASGTKVDGQAEIPSIPSQIAGLTRGIDELTMAGPELISRSLELLADLHDILGSDTGRDLRRGLRAAAELSTSLNDPSGPMQRTLAELPATLDGLRSTAAAADDLISRLDGMVVASGGEAAILLGEAAKATSALRRAADQAATVLSQNREEIQDFTARGLPELAGLVEDATRMVNEVSGLVRDVRQNPARFFFGEPTSEGVRLR